MIIPDANILLYAFDSSSPRHDAARAWLEEALSGREEIGFPLVTLVAFIRIGTDPRVFTVPLEPREAIEIVSAWLERPNARIVHPTSRHWEVMLRTAESGRARGPAMTDAHLAALTEEHGGTLYTSDRGFARFGGVHTADPTS